MIMENGQWRVTKAMQAMMVRHVLVEAERDGYRVQLVTGRSGAGASFAVGSLGDVEDAVCRVAAVLQAVHREPPANN